MSEFLKHIFLFVLLWSSFKIASAATSFLPITLWNQNFDAYSVGDSITPTAGANFTTNFTLLNGTFSVQTSPFTGNASRFLQTTNAQFATAMYQGLTNVADVYLTGRVNATTVGNTYFGWIFAGAGTATGGFPISAYQTQWLSSGTSKIVTYDGSGTGTDTATGSFTPAYADTTFRMLHLQNNIVGVPNGTTATGILSIRDTTYAKGYLGYFNGVFPGTTATEYLDTIVGTSPGMVIMNVGNSLTQGNHCAESDAYRYGALNEANTVNNYQWFFVGQTYAGVSAITPWTDGVTGQLLTNTTTTMISKMPGTLPRPGANTAVWCVLCAYNNPRFGVTADQTYTQMFSFITSAAATSGMMAIPIFVGGEIQPTSDINDYLPYAQAEKAAVTNTVAAGYNAHYVNLYQFSATISTTSLGGGSFIPACGPTGIDLVGRYMVQQIALDVVATSTPTITFTSTPSPTATPTPSPSPTRTPSPTLSPTSTPRPVTLNLQLQEGIGIKK